MTSGEVIIFVPKDGSIRIMASQRWHQLEYGSMRMGEQRWEHKEECGDMSIGMGVLGCNYGDGSMGTGVWE
jgi:hypothetical protein